MRLLNEILSFKRLMVEAAEKVQSTDKWKRIGPQLGSNPGGRYADDNGDHWYVKHSKSDDHAKNENLAHHLYKAAGSPVLDYHLIKHDGGRLGVATRWTEKQDFHRGNRDHVSDVQKHFGTHAWTSNWDSIGLEDDNQAITHKGMTTLDTGGALQYRAMGGPKGDAFSHSVGEFDSLRQHNPDVFGKMKPQHIVDSVRRVANIPDDHIRDLVHKHGPGDDDHKKQLATKMVARKYDLVARANELARKHKVDEIQH